MEHFTGWDALYLEIAEKVNNQLTVIEWFDLWHNQVGFLTEEHPFPTPALFVSFKMLRPENLGERVQDADMQMDLYYFYETFADTNAGSFNQESALDYLKTLTDIHKVFHATSGVNFSEMSRVGFGAVDTGSSGNLYRLSYSFKVIDATAQIAWDHVKPGSVNLSQGISPAEDQGGDFILPQS